MHKNVIIIESKIIFKFFIFISILLLLPISEIFIVLPQLDDGSLEKFTIYMIIYILITFFIANQIHLFKPIKVIFIEEIISDFILIVISLISFIIFLSFVLKYIHSITDILIFASHYRQGFYKGSGIFTYPILIIMPTILSILVIKQYKLSYGFYISLLLILLSTIIVGLRIFLFPIIFSLLIRLLILSKTYKFIIISVFLFFIMFMYKYLLNSNVDNMNILEIIGYMFGRANYRSILYFNGFQIGLDDLKCMLFPINQIFGCNVANFKEHFLSFNPKIPIGMPFIALYSGVAISIPKILYDIGSPIFLSFLVLYIIFLLVVLKNILISKNKYFFIFIINIFIIFIMMLIEDIGAWNKIIPIMIISSLIVILFQISNIKYVVIKRRIKK